MAQIRNLHVVSTPLPFLPLFLSADCMFYVVGMAGGRDTFTFARQHKSWLPSRNNETKSALQKQKTKCANFDTTQ